MHEQKLQERKAMMDALQLGCIPVLFLDEDADKQLWPAHWPQRVKEQTRVRIDPQQVLDGAVDVRKSLEEISPQRVAALQAGIGAHALSMHYSRDDVEGDAFDVLLRSVAQWV